LTDEHSNSLVTLWVAAAIPHTVPPPGRGEYDSRGPDRPPHIPSEAEGGPHLDGKASAWIPGEVLPLWITDADLRRQQAWVDTEHITRIHRALVPRNQRSACRQAPTRSVPTKSGPGAANRTRTSIGFSRIVPCRSVISWGHAGQLHRSACPTYRVLAKEYRPGKVPPCWFCCARLDSAPDRHVKPDPAGGPVPSGIICHWLLPRRDRIQRLHGGLRLRKRPPRPARRQRWRIRSGRLGLGPRQPAALNDAATQGVQSVAWSCTLDSHGGLAGQQPRFVPLRIPRRFVLHDSVLRP